MVEPLRHQLKRIQPPRVMSDSPALPGIRANFDAECAITSCYPRSALYIHHPAGFPSMMDLLPGSVLARTLFGAKLSRRSIKTKKAITAVFPAGRDPFAGAETHE